MEMIIHPNIYAPIYYKQEYAILSTRYYRRPGAAAAA